MAPSHVPSDHLSHPGQSVYHDASYENLFPVDHAQFAAQPWNAQLNHHPNLVSNNPNGQAWQHSTYPQQPYSPISQSYANQGHGYRTASPYQYGQFGNHGAMATYGHAPNVDPALSIDPNAIRQQQQSPYQMNAQNASSPGQSNTPTPQAVQQPSLAVQNPRPAASQYQIPKTTAELFAQRAAPTTVNKPVKNPEYEIPKGRKSGGFVVLDQAALAKATKSNALNKLVNFGSEQLHFPSNRTALPLFTPRQSVKDLKKAGADNKKLLAKKSLGKSVSKNLKRQASDSESLDDSSDDDSEYTDDEEAEPSPLPATRPDEMHAAVRYDMIKATWFPRKSQPSSEKIKESLRQLWEVVNTIQKRWRIDSKAVAEAEEQKRTGELPLLKSRVTDGRNLLQSALKAALEHAHIDVLYHIGQVKPFLYLCYQFLANRFKMQDYDGPLSSVIYDILARCVGTLTTELLEETKVIKALNSMKKNANDKNKALIQQIVEGAAAGSKKAKVSSPPNVEIAAESKVTKRPTTQPSGRISTEGPPVKKTKLNESTNGEKKAGATMLVPRAASSASISQQKRLGDKAAPVTAKVRGTQVVNKPSTLFASLNAASKKPTTSSSTTTAKSVTQPAAAVAKDKKPTPVPSARPAFSFAETMAQLLKPKEEEKVAPSKTEKQLPPETPEEKAKRLRKESRRHLRVSFRPDATLVSIRYFNHHPEEESGHDENFVRDAGDVGGEGRMFKQHKEMDDDDEDDDVETEYRPWREPSLVDFTVVDAEERKRNYEPYGGGESKPACPEKEANIRHENSTLMVFYTHPSDIPASPREPLEQQTQPSSTAPVTHFGAPPELVLSRAPQPAMSAPAPDFSNLENIIKQLSVPSVSAAQPTPGQSTYTPAPSVPPSVLAPAPDLASILSALGQGQGQPTAAQAPMSFPAAVQQPAAAPAMDLSSIMAAIASAGNPSANIPQPPPPPGWPAFPPAFPPAFNPQAPEGGAAFQTQTQPQQQQQPQHTRSGHKRQRDEANDVNDRSHGSKRNRAERDRPHGKPHKVIACRFYQKGLCNKGDDCTYIHDLN